MDFNYESARRMMAGLVKALTDVEPLDKDECLAKLVERNILNGVNNKLEKLGKPDRIRPLPLTLLAKIIAEIPQPEVKHEYQEKDSESVAKITHAVCHTMGEVNSIPCMVLETFFTQEFQILANDSKYEGFMLYTQHEVELAFERYRLGEANKN